MPVINRKGIREKKVKYKSEKKKYNASFYDSAAWGRLRKTFMSLHPLCSFCLEHGKVEPSTECHHAVPFLRGETEEEQWQLFLDENNLIPLCNKCHTAIHVKANMYNMGRLDNLTEEEWRYAHGLNYRNE